MLKSESLTNLLGGVPASAAGVKDSTMRAWVRLNDLKIGDREDRVTTRPRYGLEDAAALMMMRFLTDSFGFTASRAAILVNAAREALIALSTDERAVIDNQHAPDPARLFLVLDRLDGSFKPAVMGYDMLRWRGESTAQLRVDLRVIVREARVQLVNRVGYSNADLRYDFVDATPAASIA